MPPGARFQRQRDPSGRRGRGCETHQRQELAPVAVGDPVDPVEVGLHHPGKQIQQRDARIRDVVVGPLRRVSRDERPALVDEVGPPAVVEVGKRKRHVRPPHQRLGAGTGPRPRSGRRVRRRSRRAVSRRPGAPARRRGRRRAQLHQVRDIGQVHGPPERPAVGRRAHRRAGGRTTSARQSTSAMTAPLGVDVDRDDRRRDADRMVGGRDDRHLPAHRGWASSAQVVLDLRRRPNDGVGARVEAVRHDRDPHPARRRPTVGIRARLCPRHRDGRRGLQGERLVVFQAQRLQPVAHQP